MTRKEFRRQTVRLARARAYRQQASPGTLVRLLAFLGVR